MDVNVIKQALREGIVTIDFTKVGGDRRRMVCTLDSSVVPPTNGQSHNRDANLLVVWDIEHAGWRTIKVDSIREWFKGTTETAEPTEQTTSVIGAWSPNTQVPTTGA